MPLVQSSSAIAATLNVYFENIERDMACYRELDANVCELLGYNMLNRIISGMCGVDEIEKIRKTLPDSLWQLIANMIAAEGGL